METLQFVKMVETVDIIPSQGTVTALRAIPSDDKSSSPDPPAAAFFYSPDRGGEHPEQHLAGYAGLMQADAYAGFSKLYEVTRKQGPIIEAACWAHGSRKFFDLARQQRSLP